MPGSPTTFIGAAVLAALLSIVGCGTGNATGTGNGNGNGNGNDVKRREATEALFGPITADGPGCSGAVNVDGRIRWSNAYGRASIDRNEAFTPQTVVDIGSTSKQFTATAVALAVADGELALDDTIDDHLDGLPGWAATVTVADLVHHQSGIPDYVDLLDARGVDQLDHADQDDALAALAGTRPEFEPGTAFGYSNSNYMLLAEVIESVTGDDLATYLQDRVFEPLGLDAHVGPGLSPDGVAPQAKAQSYELNDGWANADSPWTQVGDGAVWTTPEQLAMWATQYWDSDLGTGLDQLRAAGAVEMGDGGLYGLGIMAYPGEGADAGVVLTHSGGWSGFDTGFVLDPDRRTAVAVTCNTPDGPVTGDVADEILRIWTARS